MKKAEKENKDKFSLPEIINTDLTYYMQFGWKRLKEPHTRIKSSNQYLGNTYKDNFPVEVDETNQYTGDR